MASAADSALHRLLRGNPQALEGEQRLWLAVIAVACADARSGNGTRASERAFYESESYEAIAAALGLEPADLRRRLEAAGEL